MTTATKSKKAATTKVAKAAVPSGEYQALVEPYKATTQNGEVVTVFEARQDGQWIGYVTDSGLQSRSPIANITPAPEPHPTEFTEHEPIAATYRKGNTEHQVTITATRNDGKLYRIEGPTIKTVALPIEKVMIYQPEPITIDSPAVSDNLVDDPALAEILKAPAVEPAVEPAKSPVPEGWAMVEGVEWERRNVPVFEIKGSAESPAQISNRYSNKIERDYVHQMLMGQWDWERPGSEPHLFWDGKEYHTGDGHHTSQSLQVAIDWLADMIEYRSSEGCLPDGIDEALAERFNGGLIDLPDSIPCYVKPGTAQNAHAYSLREANRFHGYKLDNEQKRAAAWDTVTDREMLREVVKWICIKTGKDYAKFADSIPADRAIAMWLGNVSAPTVADVWQAAIEADAKLDEPLWPWLLSEKRMGMDGKVQKLRAKPEPKPELPAPPQVKKLAPETEVIDGEDAIDRTGNHIGSGGHASGGGTAGDSAGETAATSTPAPTDSAPVAPTKTYTGNARFKRIEELSTSTAEKLIQQIAGEMKTKTPAGEVLESLIVAIRQELEFYVTGDQF
jgi:hypothetical protein